MFCLCHSDRLFVDQVKWKEPLILSLDFTNKSIIYNFRNIVHFLKRMPQVVDNAVFWQTVL